MTCCSSEPLHLVRMLLRISVGLGLTFIGLTHLGDAEFAIQVGAGLGILSPVGFVWGYVLPALMIVGGILLAFGIFLSLATLMAGAALASIPIGLLLKSALGTLPLEATIPASLHALLWLIALMFAVHGNRGHCMKHDAPAPVAAPKPMPPSPPPAPPAPERLAPSVVATKTTPTAAPKKKVVRKKKAPAKVSPKKASTPPAPPSAEGGLDL